MTGALEPRGVICLAVFRPDTDLMAAQIQSIREQSHRSWTCLIGIDGHDPAAESFTRELVEDDERFVVHSFDENVGFYRNFERLLTLVDPSAEWVALSDQDDVWYPEKLDTLVSLLEHATLVTASARLVDAAGTDLGVTRRQNHGLAATMIDNQITGSLAAFRRKVLDYALPFPPPTDVAYHDHWIGVVAASMGEVLLDPRVLQDYVQHSNNVIGEEQSGAEVRRRTDRLVAAGGSGARGAVRYLAVHRWGWRVAMARTALRRVPDIADEPRRALEPFAQGKVTLSLLRTVMSEVSRRHVPVGRSAAILVGSFGARGDSLDE